VLAPTTPNALAKSSAVVMMNAVKATIHRTCFLRIPAISLPAGGMPATYRPYSPRGGAVILYRTRENWRVSSARSARITCMTALMSAR
jgi:hypothetical protein